jgi:branched-chain amino acid transport system ATP-binding protein
VQRTVLEVHDLTAGYGDTTVLREVSLSVPAGAAVALLGPNGAGKSTLLRTISGLIRPQSGRIEFDGHVVTGVRAAGMAQRGLCLLPEGRGIFPSLSVRENLILQSPKDKTAESIESAIALFPALGSRLRQQAGSLSGGEQQMLALVRASVLNPKLVMVDEASLGLSPLMVERVFETFRAIVASGTALLVVEQYISRALELVDTVYLLNRGRVVYDGSSSNLQAEEVFERYLGIEVRQ